MRSLCLLVACLATACAGGPATTPASDTDGKADNYYWCSPTHACPTNPLSDERCEDDATLDHFSPGAQCVSGRCVYPVTTEDCAGTCAINRCLPACSTTGWDVEQIVVPLPNDLNDRSRHPSAVLDANSALHITSTNRDLVEVEYYTNATGEWVRRVVGSGSESLIALDSHGVVHVVYRDPKSTALNTTFSHATPDGAVYWTKEGIGAGIDHNGDGDAMSFAIDRDDTLHVAIRDRETKNLLHGYKTTAMTYWRFETISTGQFGGRTATAIAPNGDVVVVASRSTTSTFTLARKSGSAPWTVEHIPTAGKLPYWIALSFGTDGREQVAYPALVNQQWNLYLSVHGPSAWQTEMVDEHVAATTNLVVTASGRQVLHYGVSRPGADEGLWSASRDPGGSWVRHLIEERPQSYPMEFESSSVASGAGTVQLVYWAYAFGRRTHIATSCD
jgi:hypothetical protein